jgi:rubrerythrin
MAHFSGFEVVRMAMEIEQREHRFFVALARKAHRAGLREVFSLMAQDTAALLRRLGGRLARYRVEGFWDEEEEFLPYLRRLPDEQLFEAAQGVKRRLKELTTDQQALALAVEVEGYLANYFQEAADDSCQPEGRGALAWLAGEKRRHAQLLRERESNLLSGAMM